MTQLVQQFLQDLAALGWLDWTVTITALIYVVLSARNSPWGWPFGIVSCALWGYASFFEYDLYLDALLQVFYVVMGFLGLYNWLKGTPDFPPATSAACLDNHHWWSARFTFWLCL